MCFGRAHYEISEEFYVRGACLNTNCIIKARNCIQQKSPSFELLSNFVFFLRDELKAQQIKIKVTTQESLFNYWITESAYRLEVMQMAERN